MNKVLSQDDIEGDAANLIDEIIRMSDFTFQRLPMLDIIGARLVENLSAAFPDLTGALCEASLEQLDYVPMAEVVEGIPQPALLAVGTGYPFEGEILLSMDRTLLMASIDLMLGGSAKELGDTEADKFTAIELGFGERLAAAILAELQRSLAVISKAELILDRVETDRDSANITKATSLCARMNFSIAMAGHTGNLQVIVPYDGLEPIRPDLGKIYFGDRGDTSNAWGALITDQIERAHMDLEVVLSELTVPIQKIMSWKPGDTVDLGVEDNQSAVVVCADEPMFKVEIGTKNNGNVAVQITETYSAHEEMADVGNDH